jgi:hypothetical protein
VKVLDSRASSLRPARFSGWHRHQVGDAEQIIGGGDELGVEGDAGQASVTGFAPTAHAFAPAKDAFDAAPDVLAAPISFCTQRASVESGNVPVAQGGDVRCDEMLAAPVDHTATVIAFVGGRAAGLCRRRRWRSSIATAARGSLSVAKVTLKSAHNPWRPSIKACAPKLRRASLPLPLRMSRASPSVVLGWVSLRRTWP